MDVDAQLSSAQERARARALEANDKQARLEAARTAYHEEEAALAAELAALTRRTLELLKRGDPEEIQVWAKPRFGRNVGLVQGWRIPDPVYGTGFGATKLVLLDSGAIVTMQLGTKRSNANLPLSIEDWALIQVRRARSEILPDRPYAETRTDYYDLAFGRYAQLRNVDVMRRQLGVMRKRVIDALGEMLEQARANARATP